MVAAQEKRVAQKAVKATTNAAIPGNAKEKNKAIQTAQQQSKAQRKEKWDAKAQAKTAKPPKVREAKPAGTPKQPRPEALRKPGEIRAAKADKRDQRKAAGQELKAAGQRMKNTENLPGRKTTHTVGTGMLFSFLTSFEHRMSNSSTEQRSGRDVRQAVMLSHLNEKNPIAHGKKTEYVSKRFVEWGEVTILTLGVR